jgi:hypothetical protein
MANYWFDVIKLIQQIVDTYVLNQGQVVILEAGCGSRSFLNFGSESRIDGIDISDQQLIDLLHK